MHDELKILQQKYAEITSNSIEINHRYYHDALEKTNYQKTSKGPLLNIRPFEAQILGYKLGKALKQCPKAIKNTHIYYFNHADQVIMIEIYGQTENIIHRHYYFYDDNQIESIYFNSGYENEILTAINIQQKEHDQDECSTSTMVFEYEDQNLSKITQHYPNGHEDIRYP